MSPHEFEDVNQLVEEGEPQEETFDKVAWLRNMPCWALSALLHLILIVFFISMVSKTERKKEIDVPIAVAVPPPPPVQQKPPPYDPTRKRDVQRTPKVPGAKDVKVKDPIVLKREVEEVSVDMPQGTSLDNLTNVNLEYSAAGNATGINDAIGLGGGVAGAYGERWGKGSLSREGGSEGTEDCVRAALEWLRRHQSPDGSWKSMDFTQQCKKTCQNLDSHYGDGRGFKDHDVGVTGLAMLAFAGFGHTHRDGVYEEYVTCLQKAVNYLKQVQVHSEDPTTNGRYGPMDGDQWIYNHAIATMAMCEILVMSNDVIGLKKSVTDAVKFCIRAQNDGRGWRYGVKSGENDTSVTGWMVLALKTAKNARLDIPKEEFERAFAGALNWFNHATASNGKTGYQGPGDAGSILTANQKENPELYPYSKELSCMTAVAVLCRIFSGEKRSSQAVRDGVKILMTQTPKWQEQKGRSLSTVNLYYWYYGSYALFQFGGNEWKKWNEEMQKALVGTQRQDLKRQTLIDEDGSWDPIDEWSAAGGRVYSTALGAMTLEVYYRFRRAQQGVGL